MNTAWHVSLFSGLMVGTTLWLFFDGDPNSSGKRYARTIHLAVAYMRTVYLLILQATPLADRTTAMRQFNNETLCGPLLFVLGHLHHRARKFVGHNHGIGRFDILVPALLDTAIPILKLLSYVLHLTDRKRQRQQHHYSLLLLLTQKVTIS